MTPADLRSLFDRLLAPRRSRCLPGGATTACPAIASKMAEQAAALPLAAASGMEDSSTYQGILADGRKLGHEEGRVEGLAESIARMAELRLGTSPAGLGDRLESMTAAELRSLFDRLLLLADRAAFEAALPPPARPSRGGARRRPAPRRRPARR